MARGDVLFDDQVSEYVTWVVGKVDLEGAEPYVCECKKFGIGDEVEVTSRYHDDSKWIGARRWF